jgi:hypothetical protein
MGQANFIQIDCFSRNKFGIAMTDENKSELNKYIGRRTEEGICHRTSQ